jgi:amino acid adenylation domain-containing protein
MRARLEGQPSFKEHLARVRQAALGAYEHQELPFDKLVEELNPPRDLSRNPLFEVSFAMQNVLDEGLQLDGLEVESVRGIFGVTSKFDLTLSLLETRTGLSGSIEYATDLFDRDRIERMAGHYRVLLEAVVADPECSVAHLPLLTEAERQQLLVQWNDTAREYPRDRCVHQLVEEQVQRSPQAVAVVFGEQRLTYRQLDERANRLAHRLRQLGVGPEVLVAVCLERSLELVVGLLGILKAGGAYVPLDPGYPAQRLAFMLQDTAAPVLLTQRRLLGQLPQYAGRVLCLDRDWGEIEKQPANAPENLAGPQNLAYVIYTSGSTGTPKGVMIEHGSITRLVCNTDYLRLGPDDAVAQASNASFDAATFEIWGAWVNGARLIVVPKEVLLGPRSLANAIRANGISTLFLTTALFNSVARELPSAFAGLRTLLFGGEASDAKAVASVLRETSRPNRLLHVYGPTETTTFATWLKVESVAHDSGQVPIGRPIANTVAYVFGASNQLQPLGVPGELHVGGPGVARGYLNRPDLTAERFITYQTPAGVFEKLYRTGDRVRWRADGLLEFLGREDGQVKIRGFRIEPAEVEAVLATQPGVDSCLVTVQQSGPEQKALVAYVVASAERQLGRDEVRAFLAARLPDFMIPSSFVFLPCFPVTPNGKIDRSRLPIAQFGDDSSPGGRKRPSDQLELHLLKIWERLLGASDIGTTDNFFELGGHSLLAAQLIDEIERQFGRRLPLDALWYAGSTIDDLARLLRQDDDAASWPMMVPLRTGGELPALFCVHTQGGNLFHYDQLARAMAPRRAVIGLQARGVYGREPPRLCVEDIAADCIAAMTQKQATGPYFIAGFSSGGLVAFEMARQLESRGVEIGLLALLDSFAPTVRRAASGMRRWQRLRSMRLREMQERTYLAVLNGLGLACLRRPRSIGEAHRWAHWSYRPAPLRGGLVLFAAEESLRSVINGALGWSELSRGGVELRRLPGTHSSMMKPPLVHVLAGELQSLIDAEMKRRESVGPAVERPSLARLDAV